MGKDIILQCPMYSFSLVRSSDFFHAVFAIAATDGPAID